MHIHHWNFTGSEIMWATLALFGSIAMLVVEALGFRLATGKW
jgi:hypothetical protein